MAPVRVGRGVIWSSFFLRLLIWLRLIISGTSEVSAKLCYLEKIWRREPSVERRKAGHPVVMVGRLSDGSQMAEQLQFEEKIEMQA